MCVKEHEFNDAIQDKKRGERFHVVTNLLCNVVFGKKLSQDNRIEVNGLDNARQQSTLNANYVPSSDFIRTGDCVKWAMLQKIHD